jgi:hypothetical protein
MFDSSTLKYTQKWTPSHLLLLALSSSFIYTLPGSPCFPFFLWVLSPQSSSLGQAVPGICSEPLWFPIALGVDA